MSTWQLRAPSISLTLMPVVSNDRDSPLNDKLGIMLILAIPRNLLFLLEELQQPDRPPTLQCSTISLIIMQAAQWQILSIKNL